MEAILFHALFFLAGLIVGIIMGIVLLTKMALNWHKKHE